MDQNQSSEPKNVIIAVILCIGFYWVYSTYLGKKYPKPEGTPVASTTESVNATVDSNSTTKPEANTPDTGTQTSSPDQPSESHISAAKVVRLELDQLSFQTDHAEYEFNQDLGGLTSIRLADFKQDKKGEDHVQLLDSPFIVQATTVVNNPKTQQGFEAIRDGDRLTFKRREGTWLLTQTFTVPKDASDYGVSLAVKYTNESSQAQELNAGLFTKTSVVPLKNSGGLIPGMNYERKSLVFGVNDSRDYEDTEGYCDDYSDDPKPVFQGASENIDYVGFDNHYFLKVLQPQQEKMSFRFEKSQDPHPGDGCPIMLLTYQPQGLVQAGQTVEMNYRYYFGPKKIQALDSFSPKLKSALYLGWFGAIARPLLWAVKKVYKWFGNYGIAIIIITLILKMLFFPLTRAAQISMKKMQKLQPQMNAIREKNKDDPRKQQQELMKFMAQHKVNPAKGCLPILPQIPVFIAFYNVLSNAIELRHAPFMGWIQDLSVADPFLVTPLLLGVCMFMQQKLTPHPGMDKAQERIMMMMPVVFTVMMLSLPAGMVLYMLVNTIVTILQQQWLNRRLA